jgi:hypothetical protein
MRKVEWIDKEGYMRVSSVRDEDPDELAHEGISLDPPSVERLDWDAIKRDLHNQLVMRKLFTYDDLVRKQNGVTGAVLAAVRKPVITLFKERR